MIRALNFLNCIMAIALLVAFDANGGFTKGGSLSQKAANKIGSLLAK